MNRQPFSHWSTSSTSRATVAVNSPTTAAADPVRNLAHYKMQISWKEPNRCSSLAGTKSIDRVAFVRNCRRHAAVARCQRRLTPLRMCVRWGLPPALCGSLYPELLRLVCVCVGVSQRYERSRFDAVLLRIQSEVARPQLSSTLTLAGAAPVKLETRNYPDISVGLNTAALLAPHAAHSASLLCFAVTVSVFFWFFS